MADGEAAEGVREVRERSDSDSEKGHERGTRTRDSDEGLGRETRTKDSD